MFYQTRYCSIDQENKPESPHGKIINVRWVAIKQTEEKRLGNRFLWSSESQRRKHDEAHERVNTNWVSIDAHNQIFSIWPQNASAWNPPPSLPDVVVLFVTVLHLIAGPAKLLVRQRRCAAGVIGQFSDKRPRRKRNLRWPERSNRHDFAIGSDTVIFN